MFKQETGKCMKLVIELEMDNAAFDCHAGKGFAEGTEVARILRELADEVDRVAMATGDRYSGTDYNGNGVMYAVVRKGKISKKVQGI